MEHPSLEAARRVALVALSRARTARRPPLHPTARSPSRPTTQAARRHTHPLQRCGVRPGARWLFALPVPCGAQLFVQHGGPTMSGQHASEHGNNEHNNARYQHITPRCAPRERKARGQEEQSKQGGGRGHDTSWPLSCTAIQSTCCLHVGQALEHLVNHGRMQSAQYQ